LPVSALYGGEQCGQHVAQYRPGALMGVWSTAGVQPHFSHAREFPANRMQLPGPGVA